MARKTPGNPIAGSPPATDDFSLIKGIGPVFSRRLHDSGIVTYHQLASLSPKKLAKRVGGLSDKIITRQDWIGQAHKLEHPQIQSIRSTKRPSRRIIRQHYENFTIEILLDEKKSLRRTRAVHVQSGVADAWAGWDPDHLIDFISLHTGISTPAHKNKERQTVLPVPHQTANKLPDEPVSILNDTRKSSSFIPSTSDIPTATTQLSDSRLKTTASNIPTGVLCIHDFKIFSIDSATPVYSIHHGQPYHVRMTLDLTNVVVPSNLPLAYKAIVTLKQLGGASYPMIEESNTIRFSACLTLDMVFTSPTPGLYRPEALVKLFSEKTILGLMAYLKGDLIQVL